MLFISPHPLYQVLGITDEVINYHPTNGRIIGTIPGINAEFFHGGAPNWACDQALANKNFQSAWGGLPDGVDYRAYIGSFDTDYQAEQRGWDADTKDYVEQFLLNHPDYGRTFVLAEPPKTVSDLPWPTFNDLHHSRVVIVAKEIGADLNQVLEYERRNKARPVVIANLEREIEANPQPDEELVPA